MKTLTALLIVLGIPLACAAELRVPAFTAYIQPDCYGARVSEPEGITHWSDSADTISWYGKFAHTGQFSARVEASANCPDKLRFQLTVGQQQRYAVLLPGETSLEFGNLSIATAGHHQIVLRVLDDLKTCTVDVAALVLDGPATQDVHFNMKERRNAASVHLMYPVPKDVQVEAFACEVTAVEDPYHTFYMACGWHRGYFGMQVNSPSERRIIFSVWDSGDEEISRDKVEDENRVKLISKGDGVYTGDFGNEGTGGHSHLKVQWKTGEPQRFVVTAAPVDETFTIYSGYWYVNAEQKWMLISSWKAPKEGGYLRGLHSFSENFGGETGQLRRQALYGKQFIRDPQGTWQELTTAKFSHDPTGKSDRLDRSMGIDAGQFYLSHGGFLDEFTEYGHAFSRPASKSVPDFSLKSLPEVKP